MRIFCEKTANSILVMGRKTFESIPNGPLHGRIHVVVTRTPALYTPEYIDDDSVFFVRMEDADGMVRMLLGTYPKSAIPRVFVCGGADIYAAFLCRCQTLHITYVHKRVEGPNVTALDFIPLDL
jgi:dihydrofolate reductase